MTIVSPEAGDENLIPSPVSELWEAPDNLSLKREKMNDRIVQGRTGVPGLDVTVCNGNLK